MARLQTARSLARKDRRGHLPKAVKRSSLSRLELSLAALCESSSRDSDERFTAFGKCPRRSFLAKDLAVCKRAIDQQYKLIGQALGRFGFDSFGKRQESPMQLGFVFVG